MCILFGKLRNYIYEFTCTWNNVIESSSIWTRTANFLLPRLTVDDEPSTPDGVLNECVIRDPDVEVCACDGAIFTFCFVVVVWIYVLHKYIVDIYSTIYLCSTCYISLIELRMKFDLVADVNLIQSNRPDIRCWLLYIWCHLKLKILSELLCQNLFIFYFCNKKKNHFEISFYLKKKYKNNTSVNQIKVYVVCRCRCRGMCQFLCRNTQHLISSDTKNMTMNKK